MGVKEEREVEEEREGRKRRKEIVEEREGGDGGVEAEGW